eukprot:g1821.t1
MAAASSSLSPYCRTVRDERSVWWLRCPALDGSGRSNLTLTIGANHVSNDCAGPGVSPPRASANSTYAPNPAICMTWDAALNRSAYHAATQARYGAGSAGDAAWARATAARLRHWGFNTAGAWSSVHLEQGAARPGHPAVLFTVLLDMGASWTQTTQRVFPDVFSGAWRQRAERIAATECAPRRHNPRLLGYYPDNELNWMGLWPAHPCSRQHPERCTCNSLLCWFLQRERGGTAGQLAAWRFLQQRYADAPAPANGSALTALNAAWRTNASSWASLGSAAPFPSPATAARAADESAFLAVAAERYHATVAAAIRRHDPNHLLLAYRLNGRFGDDPADRPAREVLLPVARAAAMHADVLDYHSYSAAAPAAELLALHEAGGTGGMRRPVMVSEFGFRAMDSGLPNSVGAGPLVRTQAERASAFRSYITALAALPYVVGWHVFAWVDEPAGGNEWGEDSNYGIVRSDDSAYAPMVSMLEEVNAAAHALHARANVTVT